MTKRPRHHRRDDILTKLSGGDRRSIGRSAEVVADLEREPELVGALIAGMRDDDPIVRMRAADAVEKFTSAHPGLLQPYKRQLLGPIAVIEQQEVRWHVAQLLPRLRCTPRETAAAVRILRGYLDDDSAIVRTMAMQALADFAERDASLRAEVVPLLEECTSTGTPAMQSRGRRLLKRLRS